jgi:hypothetical protein
MKPRAMLFIPISLAASITFAPVATDARAATFTPPDKPGLCSVRMAGLVQPGDLDGWKAALDAIPAGSQVNLCLNSQGGSFNEAVRIVEFLAKSSRPVRTVVDRGAECYSACAIIFMAGRNAAGAPDRKLHVRAKLGFHAPYLNAVKKDKDYDASVVERAHREALRALARFLEVNTADLFPDRLLVQFLKKKPNEFLSVEKLEDAGRWRIDLIGYRKPVQVSEAMLQTACQNDTEWTINMPSGNPARSSKPIRLKDRKFRLAIPGYGDEAVFSCVSDVYDDATKGLHISLMLADDVNGDDVPKPAALEQKVKASNDPLAVVGKPLWYMLASSTKLKDVPDQ